MAHFLVCTGGTHFNFSRGLSNLLIGQIEATLEGNDVDVRMRTNKSKGNSKAWPDSSADDYIHRPTNEEIENLCAYEEAMFYKKRFKTFSQMKKTAIDVHKNEDEDKYKDEDEDEDKNKDEDEDEAKNEKEDEDIDEDEDEDEGKDEDKYEDKNNDKDNDTNEYEVLDQDEDRNEDRNEDEDVNIHQEHGEGESTSTMKKYEFEHTHPRYSFCHLAKLKFSVIPKVSLPKDKLCSLEQLDLVSDDPSEDAIESREDYAKMALLMFRPF